MNKIYDRKNEFFIAEQDGWDIKIAIKDYKTALKQLSPIGINVKQLYKEFKSKYADDSKMICAISIHGKHAKKGFGTRDNCYKFMKKHGITND